MAENRPNLPTWLPITAEPHQPAAGSSPEWLNAANPASAPASGGAPEWLGAAAPSASPSLDLPAAPPRPAETDLPPGISPEPDFPDLPPLPFDEPEDEPQPAAEAPASVDDDDDLFGIFDSIESAPAPAAPLGELSFEAAPEPQDEGDEAAVSSDIPDWLGGENLPLPGRTETAEDAPADANVGLPSWLDDADVPDLPAADESTELPQVASDDELEALLGITDDEADIDDEVVEEGMPGFRRDYRSRATGDLDEPSDEADEESAGETMADVPDWISAAAEAPAAEETDDADLDVPDWILSTAEEGDDDTSAAVVDVPDWISAEAGITEDEAADEAEEPVEVEDVAEEEPLEELDFDDLSDLFGDADQDEDRADALMGMPSAAADEMDLSDIFGETADSDAETAAEATASQEAADEVDALNMSDIFGDTAAAEEDDEAEAAASMSDGAAAEVEVGDQADEDEADAEAEPAEELAGPDLSDIFGEMDEEEAAPTTASAEGDEDDGFEWLRSPIQESAPDEIEEEEMPDFLQTLGEADVKAEEEDSDEAVEAAPVAEDEDEEEQEDEAPAVVMEEEEDEEEDEELEEVVAAASDDDEAATAEADEEEEEAAEEEEDELPDFLTAIDAPDADEQIDEDEEIEVEVVSKEDEAAEEKAEEPELPAFLAGISAPEADAETETEAEETDAETDVETDEAEEEEAAAELPDFLAGIAAPDDTDEDEEDAALKAAEAEAGDLPDWLGGIEEPEEDEAADEEEKLPAFLADIKEAPEAYEAELDQVTEEGDLPDWFSGIDAPDEAAQDEPAASPAVVSEEGDLPGWLSDIDEPDEQDKAIDAAITGQDVDINALLGATEETAAEESGSDLPDWFSDIEAPEPDEEDTKDEPEPLAAMEDAEVAIAPEGDSEGTPDWLDNITFGGEESPLPKVSLPDDTGELDEFTSSPSITSDAEISATLDEIVTGGGSVRPAPVEPPPLEIPPDIEVEPDLADQIGDLRFEQITSDAESMSGAEKIGALKELTGVIQPEMIFEGESLRAAGIADDVVISKDQAKRIELLDALLSGPTSVTVIDDGPGFPIDRWLATLVLLFAILVPSVLGFRLLPPPVRTPRPVVDTQTELNNLPLAPVVLVALEYEPDAAPEMEPLGIALLSHLAEIDNSMVYAISTRPTGPAMIDALYQQTAPERPEGPAWINLGYISGGANGISNLTIGTLNADSSPLAYDYQGNQTNLNADQLSDIQPDLVIVIAARYEHLQPWIEQAGTELDKPMIAAMSAASAPMAYPYQQSEQLVTVLSGVNDAAAYQLSRIGAVGSTDIGARWNAQALGALAAAGLIIAGGVMFGIIGLRRNEESES